MKAGRPTAAAVAPSRIRVWRRSPTRLAAATYAATIVTRSGLCTPPVTATAAAVVRKRLACVTTTPFGAAVEPEVNCKNAGSLGAMTGGGASASAPFSSASTATRSRAVGTRGITDHKSFASGALVTTRSR